MTDQEKALEQQLRQNKVKMDKLARAYVGVTIEEFIRMNARIAELALNAASAPCEDDGEEE